MVLQGRHGRHGMGGPHGPGRRGARSRRRGGAGTWEVRARIERFVEPAVLLVLRDGETHGYELADSVIALAPDDPVDLGNLYRLLRSLEAEGVVTSRWRDDLPGRSKRTYLLTDEGRQLLDSWAESLRTADTMIAAFLRRYEEGATG